MEILNGIHSIREKMKEGTFSSLLLAVLEACLGAGLIALFAQMEIPLSFTPVVVSLQSLGVLFAGAVLGSRKGALAACFYLILGALGAPVWAGGARGLVFLTGPTSGYLLAYPLQAGLMGWFFEKRAATGGAAFTTAALLLPCALQLALGSLGLARFVGFKQSFAMGFFPFFSWEIGKAALVVSLLSFKKKGVFRWRIQLRE